jgi:hypothetical protein
VTVGFFPIECSDSHLLLSSRTRTVERTPEYDNFNNEKPQPKFGNLSTHTHTEHPNEYTDGAGSAQESSNNPINHGYTAASAKLMKEFLEKGQLNPKLYPMKKGFLKHFATWLIEGDLPFTTGGSYGIQ